MGYAFAFSWWKLIGRMTFVTEIDEDKAEFNGPCYQGICLPLKLSYLLPFDSDNARNYISLKKTLQEICKCV